VNGPKVSRVPFWDISGDGKWLVYVADENKPGVFELYCRATDGTGTPRRLSGVMPEFGDVQRLQITSDSSRVLYLADQEQDEMVELYSAPLVEGGDAVKVNPALQLKGERRSLRSKHRWKMGCVSRRLGRGRGIRALQQTHGRQRHNVQAK
jgi:hypothetical protein